MPNVIQQTMFEAEYNQSAYSASFSKTNIITLTHTAGPPILVKRFAMTYTGGGTPSQNTLIINAIYEPNQNRNLLVGNCSITFIGWDRAHTDSAMIYRNLENPFYLASNQQIQVVATALGNVTIAIGDVGFLIEGSIDIANPAVYDARP